MYNNNIHHILNKNLESFPSTMFPKLWNAIEIDLKEIKTANIFKQRVINIYLKNCERFKFEKPSCILLLLVNFIKKKLKQLTLYFVISHAL